MLKLLIADDEMLVRIGIKTTIDWNSLGYEIVGEAEDGEAALEIARRTKPDVVLTDISMPVMNGLELIKALKKELPATKTLVLSCHKDFDYVREAMQNYGAMDYLLKIKMKPEELKEVMLKVREVIEKEQKKADEYITLQWQVNSNAYHIRNKLFNDILDCSGSVPQDLINRLEMMKLNFEGDRFVAISMLLDHCHEVCFHKQNAEGMRLLIFSIINICDELITNSEFSGTVFHRSGGEFGIILCSNGENQNGMISKVKGFCSQLLSTVKMYLNISASFGIGEMFGRFPILCSEYHNANKAAGHRFYTGWESINLSNKIPQYINNIYFDFNKDRKLKLLLEEKKAVEIREFLLKILQMLEEEKSVEPEKVMKEFREILNTFSSDIRKNGGSLKDIKDDFGYDAIISLGHNETMSEVKAWFLTFVDRYFEYKDSLNVFGYGSEVSKAMEYMAQNYKNEIGLRDVAEYVHINESYLSFLIKKETGKNFTDHLNFFRIEKAKEFLRSRDANASETWEVVGYSSLSYFSRVFKQITGMNPSEYKKNYGK